MTKASSHPMGAAPSSCASVVHRSSSAKSEFYPKTRWKFCNEFRCKRKRTERLSSRPCRKTNRSLNTRYPVIRSSGSLSIRLRGLPLVQRREPNHPWLHDPAVRQSQLRHKALFTAFGCRRYRRPNRSSSRWDLNQGISILGRATSGHLTAARPIERRPPWSNDCQSSQ
jgi:hypothetical protein